MQKITINSHIGSDGLLNLQMPTTLSNTECKITVILQPITSMASETPEELGWTPEIFEKTKRESNHQQNPAKALLESDFIGCGKADAMLSVNYKQEFAKILDEKYGHNC